MMITYLESDLFRSTAQVLVNPVNTVGVMGKGLAAVFRAVYPEMFAKYRTLCQSRQLGIGQLWLYKTPQKWILCFPTKQHWRNASQPEYVEKGLRKFVDTYSAQGIISASFPMLGCGYGDLNWEIQVKPLMEHYLQPLPITILIHTLGPNRSVTVPVDIAGLRSMLRGKESRTQGDVETTDLLL